MTGNETPRIDHELTEVPASGGSSRRAFLTSAGLAGAAIAGGTVLAGCTTKHVEKTPAAAPPVSGSASASPIDPAYDAAVRKVVNGRTISIGYCVPVLSEYFNEIQGAAYRKMAEYSARFGVKWKWERSAPTASYKSVEQSVGIVQGWALRNFQAVFICTSANFATMQSTYERAAKQGTQVFEYNMPIELYPASKLRTVATVGYNNNTQSGFLAGKYIAEKLKGTGNVLAIVGPSGSDYTVMRLAGLKAAFAQHPGIKIVAQAEGGYVRDQGFTATQNLLAGHKNINAIWGENEDMALGASQAVDRAGLKHWNGKTGIVIVGADGLVSGMEAIRAGKLTASVNVGAADTGVNLVETMFNSVVLGQTVAKTVYNPTQVVDKTNVDVPEAYLKWALAGKI
jgi:ABC-type sugar transport system substrate-binding protein